jgi:hypothetical protein
MSAIDFAIAYRNWLERRAPTRVEPREPIPDEHGLPAVRDAMGCRIGEHLLAEPLRLAVRLDWEADVLAKVRAGSGLWNASKHRRNRTTSA